MNTQYSKELTSVKMLGKPGAGKIHVQCYIKIYFESNYKTKQSKTKTKHF